MLSFTCLLKMIRRNVFMKKSRILGAIAAAAMAVSSFAALPASAAETYHAYLGIQSQSFTFRNAWDDGTYGKGVVGDDGMEYFNQLTGWDGGSVPLDKGGDFTDAEITADGTYKVGLSGDFDFGTDESLNLLFVSTDIPLDSGVTISDVKVIIDGQTKYTFDEAYLSPDATTYIQPMAINIWNDDLGKEDGLFGYTMPTTSVEMEFTVSGMGSGDAAAADTSTADTSSEAAPAADGTTDSGKTGNLPIGVMVAAAAAAGVTAVVSRKRK